MAKHVIQTALFIQSDEKMCLHPTTLAFQGVHHHLEKPFIDDYFIGSLALRFACFLGIALYGAFGILDAYLVPEMKTLFWLFRYAIFCPVTLAIFLFSFSPHFKKVIQPVFAFWEFLAGGSIILMIVLAPPPASFSYYAGLILVFMMGYTVVKQRFIWATASSWSLVILYEFAAVHLTTTPTHVLINNNFFFISANLIGMIACYTMEFHARRDFFLKKLLEIEREKVKQARDILEDTIKERTSQLIETNRRLNREMKEREQIQAQLLRHQKMESIGLVVGGVAHDLNNILSGVITYPELLLLDLPKDSKLRRPIEEILKSGQRAAAVVADLLTVARGVASRKEIISINNLLENYLSSPEFKKLDPLYPEIFVNVELEPDLPDCECSPIHIQKVLMNLVNNAFEAIELNGEITISTGTQLIPEPGTKLLAAGKYIVMRVADNGIGIPANVLEHIFEPFYTKKKMGRSGTGLGLAVVWNTVQEHDGTVDVVSTDSGTTFTVLFPVSTGKKPIVYKEKQKDIHGFGTILVVDDEEIQRNISHKLLTKLGYEVTTADSGEQAVDHLETHHVDLVLLDMIMEPGINGLRTYMEIIKLHPGQKTIIVSGFSESDDVKTALRLGVAQFIKKPYQIRDLGLAVKEVLGEPK